MPWSRPASVPVGRVWSSFEGRPRDGRAIRYQIRDMLPKDRKRCLDMMQKTFLEDEPLCQVLDIKSDPVSVATIRSNWESFVDQQVSVACYTEEEGEPRDLVGFNILTVKSINDEEEDIDKVKGEPWKKLLLTLLTAENLVNVFKRYNVTEYMTSSGLTVLPEHRGQKLGARIIDVSSQVLAARCGYELLAELPYSHMARQGVTLEGCDTPSAKLMGREYTS
ncbi:unnamed protein product [Leptidea sinapis]|uniref:N-acetyltransferase domain-containing protein n=1 Tax=Leptidea sinapis TaxID=189913 RepID=A0A5E4QSK8_9NEOP|nr:unnamed protein product [Leptidea sinapis]